MKRKDCFYGRASFFGVAALFLYFSLFSILGLIISIYALVTNNIGSSQLPFLSKNSKLNQYNLSLIGSIGTTLLGCSIYYIRKLYKLSLSGNFLMEIKTSNDKLENLGTMIYFMFRPIFGISFTILMLLGIKCGIVTVSSKSLDLNSSFTDLTMFLSYFIGFSTGKFLSTLEKKSEKIINNLFKENITLESNKSASENH
ncbi:hypothetical protein CF069_03845 [Clostridium botulinum]|nr:hypothetical protein [Clostridium botulinum]